MHLSPHILCMLLCTYVATYLIAEHDLATRHECGTLLCAISKKTFSMTVVRIQSTKTPNVMSKTADILEECESFPTAAKQLRGKCFYSSDSGCWYGYIDCTGISESPK